MNLRHSLPFFMIVLCMSLMSPNAIADLRTDTERLNNYLGQLKNDRLEREKLEQLEREKLERQNRKTRELFKGELITVPAGCFQMGSDSNTYERKPEHLVCLESFMMSKYEVTQELWDKVMGSNPSKFQGCGSDCPVEKVSWKEIQTFIAKLFTITGLQFRLPSEAEWEYACRGGGVHKAYCGSDGDAGRVAWYSANSSNRTYPVGQKRANTFGLYDMSGNVSEWTQDCWNSNYNGAPNDGSAWLGDDCLRRVIRGGHYGSSGNWLHATGRWVDDVYRRWGTTGFRVVLKQNSL